MKKNIIYIVPLFISLVFLISSCDKSVIKPDEDFDYQLIQNIIDANKVDINISDLPASSHTIIEQEYNEYMDIEASLASGLGYQISMDGKGYKIGYRNEIYFNLEGRKLNSEKDTRDKDGFKCFELILPFTFIMPDASSITIEHEDDYMTIRDWYSNNLDSEEKPVLDYPVSVIYKDGSVIAINNDEDMEDKKSDCKKWDDDEKDWECFSIVYPITFTMPDGSTISMLDEGDWDELKSWYDENLDAEEHPALNYPIEIIHKDGTSQTISNDDEMSAAKYDCRN